MIDFDGYNLLVDAPRHASAIKKDLGGRKDGRRLKLPPTSHNVLRLIEMLGPGALNGVPPEISDLAQSEWGFAGFELDELARAQAHPSWDDLYEFQREGVEYLVCNPHGCSLVELSWGLGKAATSIVAADLIDARDVLVLSPLTLAPAWIAEWERWAAAPRDVRRARAGDREPLAEGVTIANHEVIQEVVLRDEHGKVLQPEWAYDNRRVKAWIEEGPRKVDPKTSRKVPKRERIVRVRRDYLDHNWDLIIIDESVMLKNRRAVKGNILEVLRKQAPDAYMWELSASPVTKWWDDLFRQLQVIWPRAHPSYWRFTEFFCVVDKDGWGWTIEGNRPDHDPQHYLRDLIWRKSEEEAGIELPQYIETSIPVDATDAQRHALDQMIDHWIVELEDADEPVVAATWLARSLRLQQLTSNLGALPRPNGGFHKPDGAKLNLLLDLIDRGDLPVPLLTWTWFVETTAIVESALAKRGLNVLAVTGATTSKQKDKRLQTFKAGDCDALVLQMGVGKFGHTFTKTRSIYYHDRTFDSDAWVQSYRRVRRIGLKHRPYMMIPKVRMSADELIDANLEGKVESIAQLTNADLAEMLKGLRSDA